MKFFFARTILFFLIFILPARAVSINGQNYVSLTGWARANHFHAAIVRHEIILTDKNSRLVFEADSAESQINGVNVRLSFPIAVVKGAAWISQLDVDTAIEPLVFPQKISASRIKTICLDAGHGGKDTGNRVRSGIFFHDEKTYTLELALDLRERLKKVGFNVILTRNKDTFVDLPVRPAIANRNKADLFISLHFNASPVDKKNVSGVETYCITPVGAASSNAQGEGANHGKTTANRMEEKSLLLAYEIQSSLVQNLRAEDRDVRRARFAVLRDATMPAILIEGGYMTHPTEGKKIFESAYRNQMAAAIIVGILKYQKLTESPKPIR